VADAGPVVRAHHGVAAVEAGVAGVRWGYRSIRKLYRRYEKLKNLYDEEGNPIARLMTKLRLTPQSRYDRKQAHTAIQNTAPGPKPWDR
jgi:hypothetical protein